MLGLVDRVEASNLAANMLAPPRVLADLGSVISPSWAADTFSIKHGTRKKRSEVLIATDYQGLGIYDVR